MINCVTELITAIAVSATFIFSIYKWRVCKKKHRYIVAMKISALLEEAKIGLNIMEKEEEKSLPKKSWKGEETIPDEVMFIILAESKSEKNKLDEFSLCDIKKHCENYFEIITRHWQKVLDFPTLRKDTENIQKIKETTKKVIDMLERTKSLLEDNSKKCRPK